MVRSNRHGKENHDTDDPLEPGRASKARHARKARHTRKAGEASEALDTRGETRGQTHDTEAADVAHRPGPAGGSGEEGGVS